MILVTPCGVMDTTNFGKSEVNRQTIDFSLKSQEKKVEAKAEKEEANKDNSDSTNTDTNKKDKLLDISA
ncbi:hypothetical protein F9Y58_03960 [Campylobacter jejuni]|nr:hypothetical protein [Campylobacter jejuni]